jgi:hypothetical protein
MYVTASQFLAEALQPKLELVVKKRSHEILLIELDIRNDT